VEQTAFEVRTTDSSFLDRIRPHLTEHATTEEATSKLPWYRFSAIVGEDRLLPGRIRTRGLHSLYAQAMRTYHGPHLEEMAGSLVETIRWLSLDPLDEYIRIRGGAVALDGSGVLLASPESQPELSALVATLLTKGASYLGDWVAPVDPVFRRIHPVPFPLLLASSDASRLSGAAPRAPRRSGRETSKIPVPLDGLGSRRADPVPVRWVVFPSFEPGGETRLESAGGAEAVFGLTQACANLDVWEERGLALFRELVETAAVSRLVVGSPEVAADLLMEVAPSLVET
jgi:hypothetical protein